MTQHSVNLPIPQEEIDILIDEYQQAAIEWEQMPDGDEKNNAARQLVRKYGYIRHYMIFDEFEIIRKK